MTEILKTSEEWQGLCKIEILDADGWDRKNFDYSWHQEKITRKEFEMRMLPSTCMFPMGYLEPGFSMWKDLDSKETVRKQ